MFRVQFSDEDFLRRRLLRTDVSQVMKGQIRHELLMQRAHAGHGIVVEVDTQIENGERLVAMNQQRSGPLRQMSLAANLAAGIPAGLEGSQQAFIQ